MTTNKEHKPRVSDEPDEDPEITKLLGPLTPEELMAGRLETAERNLRHARAELARLRGDRHRIIQAEGSTNKMVVDALAESLGFEMTEYGWDTGELVSEDLAEMAAAKIAELQRRLDQAGVQEPIRIESVDLGDGRKLVPREGEAVEFPCVRLGGFYTHSHPTKDTASSFSMEELGEVLCRNLAKLWPIYTDPPLNLSGVDADFAKELLDTWKVEDA